MRFESDMNPTEFRNFGIQKCILTAINHFTDAQLLCKNNRSNSAYYFALVGLEQIGKSLQLLDGTHATSLGNSIESIGRLLLEFPFYENVTEAQIPDYARKLFDDMNCAAQAKPSEAGDDLTWIDPICSFREAEFVAELYHAIRWFMNNKYTNADIDNTFNSLDPICSLCHDSMNNIVTPTEPCNRP